MRDPRVSSIVAGVKARFPAVRIEFRPNPDPATAADIPELLLLLDCPPSRRLEVGDFAHELAFAVFDVDLPPVFTIALDIEESARCYAPASQPARVSEP